MPKIKHFTVFFLLCFLPTGILPANGVKRSGSEQGDVYEDFVFIDNIKSVRIHKKEWEVSYPIIKLNSGEQIYLSFDDLEGDVKNYSYTVVHCNADWTPSNLFPSDYIDGFYENPVRNYRFSFNTFLPYTHYTLTLPNEDIDFKLSGNYVVKVFKNSDPSDIVLTRRFFVNESAVHINAVARQPLLPEHRKTGHQIDFTVSHPDHPIRDPYSEINITVTQNNRWDNALTGLVPTFVKTNEIVYENEEKNYFPGGNEFRTFDIQSMRHQSEFVRNIEFGNDGFDVYLTDDRSRKNNYRFHHEEINGKYVIRTRDESNDATDSEYAKVHFSLSQETPFDNGDVYVMGELSHWNFYPWNRMEYNYETRAYELTMLLKQGYYNYKYVFLEEGSEKADAELLEGNFYQTENDYIVYVYHREPGSRYDRLIGVQITNSARR